MGTVSYPLHEQAETTPAWLCSPQLHSLPVTFSSSAGRRGSLDHGRSTASLKISNRPELGTCGSTYLSGASSPIPADTDTTSNSSMVSSTLQRPWPQPLLGGSQSGQWHGCRYLLPSLPMLVSLLLEAFRTVRNQSAFVRRRDTALLKAPPKDGLQKRF